MSNVIQFPTKSILTELHDDFIHCFNVIDSQLSQFHDEIGYKTLRNMLMDVNDWLQYTTKLTAIHPQLSLLHVCDNRQDANAIPEMISVASLYTDASREVPFTSPYISTTGIADATDNMVAEQLHFVINSLGVTEAMKQLEDVKLEQHRHQVKHIQRTSIVDIDDNRNADGFDL